jgi:hypothetical protein
MMWSPIGLVIALSAGLGAATEMSRRVPIAGTAADLPGAQRWLSADHFAGGVASAFGLRRPARGTAAGASRPAAADPISLGRKLFARQWLVKDPRCHGGDGLGPVYNATSCLQCHGQGGPGDAGSADRNVELITGIGYIVRPGVKLVTSRLTLPGFPGDDPSRALEVFMSPERDHLVKVHPGFRNARSAVLHRYGVAPEYDRWRRGAVVERPFYRHTRLENRDTGVMIARSARNPTPLFGAGLIDALPDAALEEAAERQPPSGGGSIAWRTAESVGSAGRLRSRPCRSSS